MGRIGTVQETSPHLFEGGESESTVEVVIQTEEETDPRGEAPKGEEQPEWLKGLK